MIFSGWILPDLYEIPCVSCSTNKGHIQIVKSFLENLKKQDSHTFSKIQNKLDELTLTNPYLPLDDFAVVYLKFAILKTSGAIQAMLRKQEHCQ